LNEFVALESLPPLEKLNAVKLVPFADLLPNGKEDLAQIVGYDIFHKLVPISVYTSASVYSERKDEMLRRFKERVLDIDGEVNGALALFRY